MVKPSPTRKTSSPRSAKLSYTILSSLIDQLLSQLLRLFNVLLIQPWNWVGWFHLFSLPVYLTVIVKEDAVFAAEGWFAVDFGKELFVAGDNFGELWIAGEVGPFIGILSHVIKFLTAISVLNKAPAFTAHAVIVVVVGGDGRVTPLGFGILQLRNQTASVEALFFRKVE